MLHTSVVRWTVLAALFTGAFNPSQIKPSAAPLEGTEWRLTHLGSKAIAAGDAKAPPTLKLDPATSTFSGSGGCNRITGTYQLKGESLTFGPVAATRMACPGRMDVEASFVNALEEVRAWRIDGRSLTLLDGGKKTVARLDTGAKAGAKPGGTPDFANKVWRVDTSAGVQPGMVYVFLSDGVLLMTSANSIPALGKWTYDGSSLTMIEEGIARKVDILAQTDDRFSIRIHNPRSSTDVAMVRVERPGPVK